MNGHANGTDNVYDDIIVGAGISGIAAAYRIQEGLPDAKYTILETRSGIGGTWDFFKYPGLRSDSDLETFGFPFRPWTDPRSIADGPSIAKYVNETAQEFGIDKHVKYGHKLLNANWSSEQQKWQLDVQTPSGQQVFYTKFLTISAGYYDYESPLKSKVTGVENFTGTVIHPQFWPEDVDYSDKRIVIVGSGATSVTLMPVLARTAKHVVMLQRSPGYIMSMPEVDRMGKVLRAIGTPEWITYKLLRLKYLTVPFLFFYFCIAFPNTARRLVRLFTKPQLPITTAHDPHFQPSYPPWSQRLCVAPDGDFFAALRSGKGEIATGVIKSMKGDTVYLENGQQLKADILVTATGLNMQFAGNCKISVDGKHINPNEKIMWKGTMLQDVPNMVVVLGYTNASWTLGADASSIFTARMIKYQREKGFTSATPTIPAGKTVNRKPLLHLNSTYVHAAAHKTPHSGDVYPWKARNLYHRDIYEAKWGSMTADMKFERVSS